MAGLAPLEAVANSDEAACNLLHCNDVLQGGGLLNRVIPCFSKGGTALFLSCDEAVVAFCTSELRRLYTLHHKSEVTAVCLHPLCTTQLYTACQDGIITLWDVSALSVVKQWNLESPICSLLVQDDTAYVSCHWRERQAGRLLAYDLAAHTASGMRVKLASASKLVISSCGQLLASINRHTATVWWATSFPHHPLIVTHTKPLTCAALSDTGDTLAVGDATGRIVVWHGIRAAVHLGLPAHVCDKPAQRTAADNPLLPHTTAHWHAGPVCCLAFAPGGTVLLSGGQEGVLVLWDMSSARRTYLPRLGSSLCHIATCINGPDRVAISLADNSVQLVDLGALRVEHSVCGVFCDPAVPADSGLLVQPGTGFLTLAHRGSILQCFDAARDAHVSCHKLPCQVTTAPLPTAYNVLASQIAPTHIMFDRTGEVLVTVDQRPTVRGGGPGRHSKQPLASVLRVWSCRQVSARSCMLSACEVGTFSIAKAVRAVAVHPDRPLVAVALGDGSITLYEVGSYRGVQHQASKVHGTQAQALAFSPDGSVVAVGATASCPVVLLDADVHHTVAVLPPVTKGACLSPVQRLSFLADKAHLAAQWHGGVAVYSLLAGALKWVCQLSTTLMTADIRSARFAMGGQAGLLFVCEATGPVNQGMRLPAGRLSRIRAAHFMDSKCLARQKDLQDASSLVVLNDVQQFAVVMGLPTLPVQVGQPAAMQTCAEDRCLVDLPPESCCWVVDAAVAQGLQATASHLLPPVQAMCPISLARLVSMSGTTPINQVSNKF